MGRTRFQVDPVGVARLGRVAPEVVRQVTEAVADDARRFVPVDTGDLKSTIEPEHLGRTGRVWVGTDHWIFPEYGTRYQKAQPYMRPALYRTRHVARVRAV